MPNRKEKLDPVEKRARGSLNSMQPEANVDFFKFGLTEKNSIRPFARTARTERGRHTPMLGQQRNTRDIADESAGEHIPDRDVLAFARGTVMIGNFGDSDTPASVACGNAKVRPAFGLPKPGQLAAPGEEDSETQFGWR